MRPIKRSQFVLILLCSILFNIYIFSYEKEIKNISTTIADRISSLGKRTVAVVDFTDLQGNVTELGRFLAEEISVSLASSAKNFEVVDRTHLKAILQEHKLSSTGLIDPQTAMKLGQITGVEALVTGTITPFGDSVRLSVKVLDAKNAKLIGACSMDIAKTKAIEELLSSSIGEQKSLASQTTFKSQLKSQQKVEIKNFLFEINECKISGEEVTCSMFITNLSNDRNLGIYADSFFDGRSVMYDDRGNLYVARHVQLANIGGSSGVELLLISGVPTRATLSFKGFSKEASLISLLEVKCKSEENFTVKFRNIPLSR